MGCKKCWGAYEWFLKGSNNLSDYVPNRSVEVDSEYAIDYTSSAFKAIIPVSNTNYSGNGSEKIAPKIMTQLNTTDGEVGDTVTYTIKSDRYRIEI